jgi:nucleotidyltransferase substrate binding protein (TIGR01987 family)
MENIRWKQRFQNFEKAYLRLTEVIDLDQLNELERNGLMQRFEYTIELAWKTLKDFLENEGFAVKSPKETIRQAFQSGYIGDGRNWMNALEIRNRLSHDYNGEYFEQAEIEIRQDIYPVIKELYVFFVKQLNNNQTNLFNDH